MKVIYDISVLGLAHFRPQTRAGIFRVVLEVARGLNESAECDLSFSATGFYESIDECLAYLEEDERLRGVPLSYPKFNRWIGKQLTALDSRIEQTGSRYSVVLREIRRPLLYADKLTGPYAPIDRNAVARADIFHSTYYPIPEQIPRTGGAKRFLTVYDLIPILFPQYCAAGIEESARQILKTAGPADSIFCISRATRDDLLNFRKDIDPSRVFITYPAASDIFRPCRDPERLSQVRRKYGIPEAPYFLSLSTIEPRKNIAHTIKSFARLIQEERLLDLHLVLTGAKGWKYEQIFQTLADCKPARDRIILTGYVADEDLAPLYSGALAFVYPSFCEGFGLPPLEAMQCGTPVITSNSSSLPEVVGQAGIMVDPNDIDGICHSMLALYKNEDMRKEMSVKSLKRAELFTWEKCVADTISAYRAALSESC